MQMARDNGIVASSKMRMLGSRCPTCQDRGPISRNSSIVCIYRCAGMASAKPFCIKDAMRRIPYRLQRSNKDESHVWHAAPTSSIQVAVQSGAYTLLRPGQRILSRVGPTPVSLPPACGHLIWSFSPMSALRFGQSPSCCIRPRLWQRRNKLRLTSSSLLSMLALAFFRPVKAWIDVS
jgi:hypothetical protein